MVMKRSEKTEAHWQGHVQAQRVAGLSVRAYCRREGLAESNFHWWRRELARREGERAAGPAGVAAFAAVEVIEANPAGPDGDGPAAGPAQALPEAVSHEETETAVSYTAGTGRPIEVRLAGGRRVVVAGGFDEAAFVRVVALLEGGAPC